MQLNAFFPVTFINRTNDKVKFNFANVDATRSNNSFIDFDRDSMGYQDFHPILAPGAQVSGTLHMHADNTVTPAKPIQLPGYITVKIGMGPTIGGITLYPETATRLGETTLFPNLLPLFDTYEGKYTFGLYADKEGKQHIQLDEQIKDGMAVFFILS